MANTDLKLSVITFGAWAAGGWMWGKTDRNAAVAAIQAAHEAGVTSIDTAPIYGQGESESIVGACALVSEDKRVAAHQVAIGAPFHVKPIRPEQIEMIRWNAAHYAELAETYRETEKKG